MWTYLFTFPTSVGLPTPTQQQGVKHKTPLLFLPVICFCATLFCIYEWTQLSILLVSRPRNLRQFSCIVAWNLSVEPVVFISNEIKNDFMFTWKHWQLQKHCSSGRTAGQQLHVRVFTHTRTAPQPSSLEHKTIHWCHQHHQAMTSLARHRHSAPVCCRVHPPPWRLPYKAMTLSTEWHSLLVELWPCSKLQRASCHLRINGTICADGHWVWAQWRTTQTGETCKYIFMVHQSQSLSKLDHSDQN